MNQLPAHLQNRPYQSVTEELAGSLPSGAPPLLSLNGDRFTLIDTSGGECPIETFDKGVPYCDCVLIHSNPRLSKIYYENPYNPNESGPPTCFSDNGVAPSKQASQPQSQTCASCQWFPWGSATSQMTGKGVKACKDYSKIAVMVPGYEGVYLLRVPPNSLKELKEYTMRSLGSKVELSDVITRVSIVQKQLHFIAVNYITADMAEKRNAARMAKVSDQLIGLNDQPIGQLPAPQTFTAPAERLFVASHADFPPTSAALPQTQIAPPAQAASPSKRAPGRPRKHVDNGGAGQPAPAPAVTQPANFGIAQPEAPGPAINKALDDFFGPAR